jgi:hypothetical protein
VSVHRWLIRRADAVIAHCEVAADLVTRAYDLDGAERARWQALAEPLWFPSTRTVGRRAGSRGQFRRIGTLPFQGQALTLAEHRRGDPQQGIRALVAGGRWRVQTWEEVSKKTGKVLKFTVALPAGRYTWRPIAAEVWSAMGLDQGGWAQARREAFRSHAEAAVDPLAKRDNMHSIRAALDDRVTFTDGEESRTTTRRSQKAAELWTHYLVKMAGDPLAVWDDTTQAIRRRALDLDRPSLLEVEGLAFRQLRRDLGSSF